MTRQRLQFWVRAFSTLWVLATVATVATLAQAAPPPTEAFFQQPAFSQAQLSPDGRHVALVAGGKGTRQRLVVMALDTQKLQVVGGFDDRDVRAVQWVNDRRLVYDLEVQLTGLNRVDEGRGLFAVDVDGGSHRQLIESVRSFARDADMGVPALSWRHFVVAVPGLGLGDSIYVGMAGEVSREKVDYIDIQRLDTRSGRTADVEIVISHALTGKLFQTRQDVFAGGAQAKKGF